MRVIDLSHTMTPDMPVYPGTEQPRFQQVCSFEEMGCIEKKITMFSHTGTHMDAPAHIIQGGSTLNQFPIDQFHGTAWVLNVGKEEPGVIGMETLASNEEMIRRIDFLLIRTSWTRFWGKEQYFSGYPVLSKEAARYLCEFDLKGIGMDAISFDEAASLDFYVHKLLLGRNNVLIENLTNLELLPDIPFLFSCFPLKFEESDGSPVRAVAML